MIKSHLPRKHYFIISDIHLGGLPNSKASLSTQLCPPSIRKRLSGLIGFLNNYDQNSAVDLVINGDFIDFLLPASHTQTADSKSIQPAFTTDTELLERKLKIALYGSEDEKNADSLISELSRFVSSGNKITLLMGNHDLEWSLPEIRRGFIESLAVRKKCHVELIFDGEAYERHGLLVEHGNRYDGWNAVNYSMLRSYRSARSRREKTVIFNPPAGSHLVTKIMNRLKGRYGFIDLLKPENHSAIPLLLSLEPGLIHELKSLMHLLPRVAARSVAEGRPPKRASYISAIIPNKNDPLKHAVDAQLNLIDYVGSEDPYSVSIELLDGFVGHPKMANGPSIREMQISSRRWQWIHDVQGFWQRYQNKDKEITDDDFIKLREGFIARRHLIKETSDIGKESEQYLSQARRLISLGSKVVVFGHTHLPKFVPLPSGGIYINSGTWCPIIKLPQELYDPGLPSKDILPLLKDFTDDLIHKPLEKSIRFQSTFAKVSFSPKNRMISAGLYEMTSENNIVCLKEEGF